MEISFYSKLSQGYSLCPVYKQLTDFTRTPDEIFLILRGLSKHCFLLESAAESENGRYTFIGYDPDTEITVKNHVLTVRGAANVSLRTDNPSAEIARILGENRAPKLPELPPFTGGLVGYFSYEYIGYIEPTLPLLSDDAEFNDIDLMMFKKIIALDKKAGTLTLITNVSTDHLEENVSRAEFELSLLENILRTGKPITPEKLRMKSGFTADMTAPEFTDMVKRAKDYIKEGDIFQAVLSNRIAAEADGSLFETYRYLKKTNPSPYMLYFSSDMAEIAGSAPETLVSVTDGEVSTFPLAGTRKRGKTAEEDKQLETELLADEKERSEHNMLVDLGRNDIGKISEIGSVNVKRYMDILRFSHVMHIGSEVSGRLKPEYSAVDAVGAVIPAGTLSGAPKIRACEIIHELERSPRGIYGGAFGYFGFDGGADFCIAIRLAYKKGGRVYARSGAGIVADSVPENEYEECIKKLGAVTDALKAVSGGELNDSADR
jgi:anthranilate synthase component 1